MCGLSMVAASCLLDWQKSNDHLKVLEKVLKRPSYLPEFSSSSDFLKS